MTRGTKISIFTGIAFIIAAGLLVTFNPTVKEYILDIKPATPHNTPIIVAGGSIHGQAPNGWTMVSALGAKKVQYAATEQDVVPIGKNIDYIEIKGFTNNPAPLTNTGGWRITYDSPHFDGVIRLCSAPDCSLNLNATGTVYMDVDSAGGRLFELRSAGKIGELRFHENAGGTIGDTDNPPYDKIVQIKFATGSNHNEQTLPCPGKGCDVTIGRSY